MTAHHRMAIGLWFDDQAEQAVEFYSGIFRDSKVGKVYRYGAAGFETHKRPAGSVMTIEFELNGQAFTALNGGPLFKFNESVALEVNCRDQREIDYYWERLTQGGDRKAQQCGWLKDRFGISWKVVPTNLLEIVGIPESERSQRAFAAMMKMKRIDIAELHRAYDGVVLERALAMKG